MKKHFKKLQKYQCGIDYLLTEDNEEENILNSDIKATNNVRMFLNELRDNLSYEEKKRIREKLYKQEAVYNFLMEKDSLTNKEKKVLMNIDRYLKNVSKHLKNLKKHFKKTQYDTDYLFNEPVTSNDAINEFKKARKLLNDPRSNLLCKETNKIKKRLHKKETVYNSLKKKDSLTNEEKKALKNIDKYLKNFKKDLEKLQKYQFNITHGIDYLFNEEDHDYYKPTEVKSAFDGSYKLHESKGDKDNILSID